MKEILPRSHFLPPEKHLYPASRNAKTVNDFTVMNFVPNVYQVCITRTSPGTAFSSWFPLQPFVAQGVDSWDFVLRGMFIQKTKPVKKVVG